MSRLFSTLQRPITSNLRKEGKGNSQAAKRQALQLLSLRQYLHHPTAFKVQDFDFSSFNQEKEIVYFIQIAAQILPAKLPQE